MNESNKNSQVSIIMPAYNCAKYISASIDSVLRQTNPNWELIIVDDYSSDETVEVVEDYSLHESRIFLIKLFENKGAGHARNTGIQHAKSRYIAFLDSDDIWHQDKLQKQLEFMKRNNAKFSCTYYGKIDSNGNIDTRIIKNRKQFDYSVLLKEPPGNSSVIYDSEFVGLVQIPNIRKRNDYVMWLQIIKITLTIHTIDEVLMYHRIRKDSLSKNKVSLIKYHWNIYRSIERLSIIKSVNLIIYWILKTLSVRYKR